MLHRKTLAAATLATATLLSASLTASAAPTSYETYVGSPTFGVPGAGGAGSDTAVSFPGSDYVSSPIRSFGSTSGTSSYEFVFKSNTVDPTNQQALFGVFNASDSTAGRTGNQAVSIGLNSANSTGSTTPGTTRFYLRDEDNQVLLANIDHGNLLDGEYHHFVVTTDVFAPTLEERITAYVDGVVVPTTYAESSTGTPTDFLDFTVDPAFAARNVRGTVGNFADVTIDEATLYDYTLTAEQVAANFAATTIPEPTTLGLLGVAGLGLLRRRTR
jgi:hypothetical protein